MPLDAARALTGLRVLVAALLFIHGMFRLVTGGVIPFGAYLMEQQVPAGAVVAWVITLMEIGGTLVLAAGRWVRPLAIYFALELSVGILMVHRPEGWFVVGGGRNGMEYSVALIGLLLAQAWAAPGASRTGD